MRLLWGGLSLVLMLSIGYFALFHKSDVSDFPCAVEEADPCPGVSASEAKARVWRALEELRQSTGKFTPAQTFIVDTAAYSGAHSGGLSAADAHFEQLLNRAMTFPTSKAKPSWEVEANYKDLLKIVDSQHKSQIFNALKQYYEDACVWIQSADGYSDREFSRYVFLSMLENNLFELSLLAAEQGLTQSAFALVDEIFEPVGTQSEEYHLARAAVLIAAENYAEAEVEYDAAEKPQGQGTPVSFESCMGNKSILDFRKKQSGRLLRAHRGEPDDAFVQDTLKILEGENHDDRERHEKVERVFDKALYTAGLDPADAKLLRHAALEKLLDVRETHSESFGWFARSGECYRTGDMECVRKIAEHLENVNDFAGGEFALHFASGAYAAAGDFDKVRSIMAKFEDGYCLPFPYDAAAMGLSSEGKFNEARAWIFEWYACLPDTTFPAGPFPRSSQSRLLTDASSSFHGLALKQLEADPTAALIDAKRSVYIALEAQSAAGAEPNFADAKQLAYTLGRLLALLSRIETTE